MQLKEWWQLFFDERRLDGPTGAPLYSYRVTDREFSELEAMLRERLRMSLGLLPLSDYARLTTRFPALFVLYAAEWWRRRYDGTGWSWDPIVEDLGAPPTGWNQAQRSEYVERGLADWNLRLTNSRGLRFLGSIAFQGGLPMQLLASARGNIGRVLSKVLRLAAGGSFEASDIQAWIQSFSTYLPPSYRQAEIFALLTEVILCVRLLTLEAKLTSANGAVEALDRQIVGWRNRFPFPIEDAQAQGLIEQLIPDAADAKLIRSAKRITVERRLELLSDNTWQLSSDIELPDYLASDELATLFEIEKAQLTRTMTLRILSGDKRVELNLRKLAGKERYLVERCPLEQRGICVLGEHSIALVTTAGEIRHRAIARGEALSAELPWVFEPLANSEKLYRLVRQSGGATSSLQALVCVPEVWVPQASEIGHADLIGKLCEQNRSVWMVNGEVKIADSSGHSFRIRCGYAAATEGHYEWIGGRVWESFITPPVAFRGAPKLYRVPDEGLMQPVQSAIAWRLGTGRSTTTPTGLFGPVDAIWPAEGEPIWRSRLVLLPEQASIKIEGGENPNIGSLQFQNYALIGAQSSQPDIAIRFLPSGINSLVEIEYNGQGSPPEWCELSIIWHGNPKAAKLRAPFPAKGARAFDGIGNLLPDGARVAVGSLAGIRVIGFLGNNSHAELQIGLHTGSSRTATSTITRKISSNPGESRVEIRLIDQLTDINRMLAGAGALDSTVAVRLRVGQGLATMLRVSRYECELEKHALNSSVGLPQDVLSQFELESILALPVRILRLDAAGEEPIALLPLLSEGVATGMWRFPREELSPGPWLIFPGAGSTVQFRPLLWPLFDEASETSAVLLSDRRLSGALNIGIETLRHQALDLVIEEMGNNFQHDDWHTVEQLASQLGHLPLSTLDIWRRFSRSPRSMAAIAIRLGTWPSGFIDRFSTELPMLWEAIPSSAWCGAMSNLLDQCNQIAAETGPQLCTLHLDGRIQALATSSSGINPVLWIARAKSVGPIDQVIQRLQHPAMDSYIVQQLFGDSESLLQQLLRTTNRSEWPGGFALAIEQAKQRGFAKLFCQSSHSNDDTIINLPILLGMGVATDAALEWCQSERVIQQIRTIQAYAPEWFADAFDLTVKRCLATQIVQIHQ